MEFLVWEWVKHGQTPIMFGKAGFDIQKIRHLFSLYGENPQSQLWRDMSWNPKFNPFYIKRAEFVSSNLIYLAFDGRHLMFQDATRPKPRNK